MNTPNFLTALRVLLTFLTALLLCLPLKYAATAAFVIYCAAGATDWFDSPPQQPCHDLREIHGRP